MAAKYDLFHSTVLYMSPEQLQHKLHFDDIFLYFFYNKHSFFESITHLHAAEYDVCIDLKLAMFQFTLC